MKYSMDTSALLDGYTRLYPPDVFPQLWDNIDRLINQEELRATSMVLFELERKDDDVLAWAKSRDELFVEVDEEIQEIVAQIMGKFPRLVAEGGQRNLADPFVIAFARQHKLIVITAERRSGSEKKPTIPYICREMGVKHISLLQLIRQEKWSF